MGNIFVKKVRRKINNDELYTSLIGCNINEKLIYLETKLENLDNDFYVYRENVNANLKVISKDIWILYDKIPPSKN